MNSEDKQNALNKLKSIAGFGGHNNPQMKEKALKIISQWRLYETDRRVLDKLSSLNSLFQQIFSAKGSVMYGVQSLRSDIASDCQIISRYI